MPPPTCGTWISSGAASPVPLGLLLVVVIPLALLAWWGWARARRSARAVRLRHALPASIACGLLLAPAAFVLVITPFTHAGSLDAGGARYQLARIDALIDRNFAVYRCDPAGLWCDQLVRSSDYSMSGDDAHFETDSASGEVRVMVCTGTDPLRSCRSPYTFQP